MKANENKPDLIFLLAHIEKHLKLLNETLGDVVATETEDIPKIGKTPRSAMLLAALLENYYTCCETMFIRISQFFENNLAAERWHRDLLERMTLGITTIRPRVLSDPSYRDLLELMRFRHFKRYYFARAYDWDRLSELLMRLKRLHPLLDADIKAFTKFLQALQ